MRIQGNFLSSARASVSYRMLATVIATTLISACAPNRDTPSSRHLQLQTQCIAHRVNNSNPAVAAAMHELIWSEQYNCYALHWRIAEPARVRVADQGSTTFWVDFPSFQENSDVNPLIAGESVVVQSFGQVEVFRHTGEWGGERLTPTGEMVYDMQIMRHDRPSRQRFLVGKGYAVMVWLPEDGAFSVEDAKLNHARITLSPAAEAFIWIAGSDLRAMSSKAAALQSAFRRFRVVPASEITAGSG